MQRNSLSVLAEATHRCPRPAAPTLRLVGEGIERVTALGQLLAEFILDGAATTLDVRALRPSRFDEGEPNAAPEFL